MSETRPTARPNYLEHSRTVVDSIRSVAMSHDGRRLACSSQSHSTVIIRMLNLVDADEGEAPQMWPKMCTLTKGGKADGGESDDGASEDAEDERSLVDHERYDSACVVQFIGSDREECLVAAWGSRLIVLDSNSGEELSALPLAPAAASPTSIVVCGPCVVSVSEELLMMRDELQVPGECAADCAAGTTSARYVELAAPEENVRMQFRAKR